MRNDSRASTAAHSLSFVSRTLARWLFAARILLIVSVSSCARGVLQRPEPHVTDANTQVVAFLWPSVELTTPLTPELWRASPWYRDEDLVTPSRVVISTGRFACIMRDGDTRQPRATQPFTCADAWRYPRSRGR